MFWIRIHIELALPHPVSVAMNLVKNYTQLRTATLQKSLFFFISVADPGCLSPGSEFFPFRIPDPGFASKNVKYFNPENCVQALGKRCSGLFIPVPDTDLLPIPNPGVKKAQDPDP